MSEQVIMKGLSYIKCGDYYIPQISIPASSPIGYWGRQRKKYLQEYRPILFNALLLQGKLFDHLAEIDRDAVARMETIVQQMKEMEGVTEELKAHDPMRWVGMMNNINARAREIVLQELICA